MAGTMGNNEDAFGERLSEVLEKEPSYYQLLVTNEPTKRMWDLVESLALDSDPMQPETTLALFQELSEDVAETQAERWLAGLRDAARCIYQSASPGSDKNLADRLMHLVYTNPNIYELVASAEPGYGLLEIVESLALEGSIDDIESMLELIRQLSVMDPSL
jgi:hypothetical protein